MSELIKFNNKLPVVNLELRSSATFRDALRSNSDNLKAEVDEILSKPLSELDPDTFQRLRQLLDTLLGNFFNDDTERFERNTWDLLSYSWKQFEQWCNDNSLVPLPATVNVFTQYLSAASETRKPATLASHRWAVSSIHVALGLPDPTAADESKRKLVSIRKQKAKQRQNSIRQASAFRKVHLRKIQELWGYSDDLRNFRDAVMLSLAYEGLLRESELARILASDLRVTSDGTYQLYVPYTKTKKDGEGMKKPVSPKTYALVMGYIERANIDSSSLLFTAIHHRTNRTINQPKPLTGKTVDTIFARAHQVLKDYLQVPQQVFSGHSARVGAAQDLLARGYSIPQIQQAGGWESPDMVLRYGKDIMAGESAMATMMADDED